MDTRAGAYLTWVRATAVGAIAFTLGVGGHLTAGGAVPEPFVLGSLLTACVLLSVPLLRTQASPLRLAGLLVAGQGGIHLVLASTARHEYAGIGHAGMAMPGGAGDSMASMPTMGLDGHLDGPLPMLAAHLVAAAVVGLWLGHGERCLWHLIAIARRHVLGVVNLTPPLPSLIRRDPSRAVDHRPAPASPWLIRPVSRRGPPVLLA